MEREYLKDWTKDDKYCLFIAIKRHGSDNIRQIQLNLPHKSLENIEKAITYYRNKALKQEVPTTRECSKESGHVYVPLNSWAKLLTETIPFNELQTETATALRIIADFENIPQAVCTEKIDFKKVYHNLANALEGKALCEDKLVAAVIDKCITETALTSKAFMKCSAYKNVLKNIRINEKELSPFVKPTENNEVSLVRQVAMQKNYNPLNISEQHLKYAFLS